MVPEPGSCGRFIVTGFVEAFAEKIICQFSSLWQEVASVKIFEIDPSIAVLLSEVVFVNEYLRDIQDLDANIIRTLYGRY